MTAATAAVCRIRRGTASSGRTSSVAPTRARPMVDAKMTASRSGSSTWRREKKLRSGDHDHRGRNDRDAAALRRWYLVR